MKKLFFLVILTFNFVDITNAETFKVTVSRESQDLYKVQFQDIYIQTQFCYEYAFSAEAILNIESNIGITIGKLIFLDSGQSCEVKKVLS